MSICRCCCLGRVVLGVGAGLWCPPKLIGLAGPPPNSKSCRILMEMRISLKTFGRKKCIKAHLRTLGDRIDCGPPICCEDKDLTGSADKAR